MFWLRNKKNNFQSHNYLEAYACIFSDKKGHSRSDSRTDNSANKGSLKDFLQFFFTNRKNLTEIQDKGIYKGKRFTVN